MVGGAKEVAPSVTRATVIINPDNPAAGGFLGVIEASSSSLGVRVSPLVLRSALDSEVRGLERELQVFAGQPNGGMIVLPDFAAISMRQSIVALAARYRLPAVYPFRYFTTIGGLMSYGIDQLTVQTSSVLRRSHFKRREAGGPSGANADQIRVGDQSQDG